VKENGSVMLVMIWFDGVGWFWFMFVTDVFWFLRFEKKF
jgi:hypothetical protein